MTAHKLLYQAKPNKNGTYSFIPRKQLENPLLKVIVIDELSMVNAEMWNLLLSHGVYVIAAGDPGQLPVISGTRLHLLEEPHVFLDEIVRQAAENEIIQFSMHLRDSRPIATYNCQNRNVMILNKWQFTDNIYQWADMIICATNDKRKEINAHYRELLGFGKEPQIGDKIIGLHNEWDFTAEGHDEIPLTNGTIGTIIKMEKYNIHTFSYIYDKPIPVLKVDMKAEDGHIFKDIVLDYIELTTGVPELTNEQKFLMSKNKKSPQPPFSFNYAYCLSAHKSQGSEWPRVVFVEEKWPTQYDLRKKLLYTAATRCSQNLVVIKK